MSTVGCTGQIAKRVGRLDTSYFADYTPEFMCIQSKAPMNLSCVLRSLLPLIVFHIKTIDGKLDYGKKSLRVVYSSALTGTITLCRSTTSILGGPTTVG
jgi:hypothetical protein